MFSVSSMVPNGCMYTRVQTHVQTQSSPMLYHYKLFSEDLIPCLNPVSVFRPADDAAHEAKSGELSFERLFNRVVVKLEVKRLGSESSDGDLTLSHLRLCVF